MIGRVVAQKLSAELGQQVVVDNRSGAAGSIGAGLVANGPADGHTLLMGALTSHSINAALFGKKLFKQFGRALVAIGIAIAPFADTLLEAFTKVFEYIADMDPDTLAAIVTGILGFVVASQAAAGSLQILKTITTPFHSLLGAVVFIFIALGAALIYAYQHNEDFRESVDKVFAWIRENKTMLMQMGGWVLGLAAGFFAVTKIIIPLINGIKLVWFWVSYAWRTFGMLRFALALLGGPVGIVIAALTLLGLALIWLWHNSETFRDVVTAAFDFIGQAVRFLWERWFKPYFTFLWTVIKSLGEFMWWLWTGVFWPVINLIGTVIGRIFKGIWETLQTLGGWFRKVWMEYIDPVLDKFGLGASDLAGYWQTAMDAIGAAWDWLQEKTGDVIRWVVDVAINRGFVDNFNKIAEFFGTEQMKHLNISALDKAPNRASYGQKAGGAKVTKQSRGWATGGYTGPGSKYQPAGVVHADEYVIRKESTNKIRSKYGLQVLDYVNQFGELPGMGGYASGGLVAFGKLLQSRGFKVNEHPAFGGVNGVHSRTGWHYRGGAIDVNWPNGQRQSREETERINAIVGLAKGFGLRTLWQWANHYDHAHFDIDKGPDLGNFSGANRGKRSGGGFGVDLPDWLGNPLSWIKDKVLGFTDKLQDSPMTKFVTAIPMKVISMATDMIQGFLGMGSDLATDKPRDVAPQQQMHTGGLVHNGTMMYDNGGYLPPGVTQVVNLTGRPEPVFTASQFDRMGTDGGGRGPLIGNVDLDVNGSDLTAGDVVGELMFELERVSHGGKYERNG